MNDQTLLFRQAHPNFVVEGMLTSQAFTPFPKDQGNLSVYDGDQVSPQEAYRHYTEKQHLLSALHREAAFAIGRCLGRFGCRGEVR